MEFKDKIKLSTSFVDNKFKEGYKIAKGISLSSNQQVAINILNEDEHLVETVESCQKDDVLGLKGQVTFSASAKNDKVYTNINLYPDFVVLLGQVRFPEF